jgi:hypothetical protein
MALKELSNPKKIEFTPKGGTEIEITTLSAAAASMFTEQELTRVKLGTANVLSTYSGPQSARISVTTTDRSIIAQGIKQGTKCTGIVLTAGGATDSMGAAIGADVTYTMSKGVIEEAAEVELSNENGGGRAMNLVFRLDRDQTDTSDPTYTVAEVS